MGPNIPYNSDIIYLNAQSIVKNRDQVQESITCYNPKLILLSETRTTADIEDSEIKLEKFNHVRCDSDTRHTGGVILYVRSDYNFSVFKTFKLQDNYWCKLLKIDFITKLCIVGCLYHSPSSSDSKFIEDFEIICDVLSSCKNLCVLVGDFNINLLSDSFYSKQMKSLLSTYGIEQYVTEPTRVTDNSSTLVDYVLSNQNNLSIVVYDCPKITDHSVISVNLYNIVKTYDNVKKFRNLNIENLKNIKTRLIMQTFNLDSVDTEVIYQEILEKCELVIDDIAPIETCHFKTNLPWFDYEVYDKIKLRDRAYRNFKTCSNLNNEKQLKWQNFKVLRNGVVNLLKQKKRTVLY